MNKTETINKVKHIHDVHSKMYTLSELRWFRANHKSLVRIREREIKTLKKQLKDSMKELSYYKKTFKAYDKVIKEKERVKKHET